MNLTRRGWTVVALLAVGTALAVEFGTRSLAAAVVPLALALLVSLLGVARVPRPTVDRHAIVDGHVDDRRTVSVSVTGVRSSMGWVPTARSRISISSSGSG